MNIPRCITIDYETDPITTRPDYPPEPVGVAIHWPDDTEGTYWAFSHPTGNNCTKREAQAALQECWDSGLPLLFHHAKFDMAVSVERMEMPMLPWQRLHDSMFLAYLCDPHARSLGLKELAEDMLGEPPEERNALFRWIMDNGPTILAAYPHRKSSPGQIKITAKQCGAWIFATPGQLCGTYAVGDTTRTRGLFNHLWPIVQDNGMGAAYDRERQLVPILMENEKGGMRVNMGGLNADVATFGAAFNRAEDWLRRELRASGLNFDADADVANVLLERGIVPADMWTRTKPTKAHPNGVLAMNKDALQPSMFSGPNGAAIASALGYRNRLKTCLDMFMRPWLDQAGRYGGYITTNWNQVRNAGASDGGTRTGRPSTDKHNFLNLSKSWDGRDDGYLHPGWLEVPALPLVRGYIMPDEGDEFLHRDFSGQELRVFAHFEQGDLWDQYQADPKLDPHAFIGSELMRVAAREIERTKVKTLNFQSIYGGGVPALQAKLRCSFQEAKELKAFHNQALPGRKILNEEITRVIRRGDPIRTWGGRLYYAEAPDAETGRDKIYKLINYIVQGSAADLTKQSIIDWDSVRHRDARFMVTVYDEINISGQYDRDMATLRDCMEAPRLTVPMLSDGKRGPSWGKLEKCQ